MAAKLQEDMPKPQISWIRGGLAFVILAAVVALGMWSATVPAWDAWSKAFLHAFDIVFGALLGTLGLEAATSKK